MERIFEEMKRIDAELAKKYLPNAVGEPEDSFQTIMWLATDVEIILLQHGIQIYDTILSVFQKSPFAAEILSEYCNLESIRRMVEIRMNFREAFLQKTGHELSCLLKWTLFSEDICELAKLHRKGEFRKEIEELVFDCGFGEEAAAFACGDYGKYLSTAPDLEFSGA